MKGGRRIPVPPEVKHHWVRSWKMTWDFLKRHRWTLGGALAAGVLVIVVFVMPRDLAWFRAIRGSGEHQKLAQNIGHLGSVAQYNVAIVLAIWVWGVFRKSRFLRRVAMITVVTTILAGLFCNVFRVSMGRPRPFTGAPPMAFRGPQTSPHYHGFPSGHVSTAFGTAVPVLIALPEVGVPVTAFAFVMGWARIYDRQHYPSDVLVGALIGTLFGIAGGTPLARLRRRLGKGTAPSRAGP